MSKIKNILFKYLLLSSGLFVAAINYNLFIRPNKIISGGSNGLSIITEELFGIDPAIFTLIFCVVILIFSFYILGLESTTSSMYSVLVYPLFISLTEGISSISYLQTDDVLLIGIFAGIISGAIYGMICKIGYSQGGVIQISQMISKIFKIPIGKCNLILNSIIIICGAMIFGLSNALIGIVVLAISSYLVDKIVIGISSNKSFIIITEKEKEVKEFIYRDLGHGCTPFFINDKKRNNRSALMTVIPTKDYYKLKDGLKKIDKNAFYVVTDSYQVHGGI